MHELKFTILELVVYTVLFLLTLFIARIFLVKTTGLSIKKDLIEEKNLAAAFSIGGFFAGICAACIGALSGSIHQNLWFDLIFTGAYCWLGILLVMTSRFITDKMILSSYSTSKKIKNEQHLPTGIVEAASYISAGLLTGAALNGEHGNIVHVIIFFLLGQFLLVITCKLYFLFEKNKFQASLLAGNTAAALYLAGIIISAGILVMSAISPEFTTWEYSLTEIGYDFIILITMLLMLRWFFDFLIIPSVSLKNEIFDNNNISIGLLKMIVLIIVSSVLYYLL